MDHVVVVGAGIVGLAVARAVAQEYPDSIVTVLDKEPRIAAHQTGHNSGVVHAGLYYAPGSLKARLCRRGMTLLREYCAEKGIAYDEAGKLVIAADDTEVERLRAIEQRSIQNEVPGLRWLGSSEISELEPNAVGKAALHSPRTAITDFEAVAHGYADDVMAAGGRVLLNTPVTGIRRNGGQVRVETPKGQFAANHVILCGGLHSDRLAKLAGDSDEPAIVPFRGEYLDLVPNRRDLVNGLIYPVPDPSYPFLGVHFTRHVDGRVDIGPNAVLALAREGYRFGDVVWKDIAHTVGWPGFRALAREHWRMGIDEVLGSLSRSRFVTRAQRYVPSLTTSDVRPGGAGVRAQALDRNGDLVDDFRINHLEGVTAVRNAPSPAATSSLAIAEHVLAEIVRHAGLPRRGVSHPLAS